MEEYKYLLKKAMEKIPKKISTADRFQVPEPIIEIQGNKTLIKNFADIANVLRREPDHLAKYLYKELATPGNLQKNILILQSKVPSSTLKKKIEDYTKNYVYCKICGEPDTKLVKDNRLYFLTCEACGAKSPANLKSKVV